MKERAFCVSVIGICSLTLVDLVQLGKQFRILRNALVVLLGKPNHALLVDNEDGAFGISLWPQAVIHGADGAVRPKIRQHRKIDPAHLLGKRFVGKRRIDAYAQDLSITGFEFFAIPFEAAELPLSAAGKIERIKCQHDILLPHVILQ